MAKQFRWSDLEKNKIKLLLGSDAPVEHMNIGDVIKSVHLSKDYGIPPLQNDLSEYLSYPGESPLNTRTHINADYKVEKVSY